MFKYIKNQIINLVNKNQPKEFGEYFNNAYHTPKDIHKDIIKNIQYWLNEEEPRCKQVKFKVAEPVYGTDVCILKVDIKVYIKDAHTGTIEFELHDNAGFSNHEHYSILKFAQDEYVISTYNECYKAEDILDKMEDACHRISKKVSNHIDVVDDLYKTIK
jgi:hypothetical protein|nr:MAG TPA: hypothetical protein [Caudoviricetes sp.]